MDKKQEDYVALVYLSLKPEVAKRHNLPLKLPVRAEDMLKVMNEDKIPLEVVVRGLESQLKITPEDEYYRSYLISAYLEKVKEAIREKSPETARVYLEKAGKVMEKEDHRYSFFKGLIAKMHGDLASAERELRISLQKAPSDLLANFELANILLESGEYEDALNYYKACMEIEPQFSLSYLKAGDAYMSMRRFDKAEEMYKRVSELDANMVEPYIRLGVGNNIQQRFKRAIEWFEKGMQVKKDEWSLYYNAAYSYDKIGRIDKAIWMLKYVIDELHVDLPFVYNELGLIYQKLGLYETALDTFLRGLDSAPNDATLVLNTANLYRSLNMVNIAKEYYLRLGELNEKEKMINNIYDMYEERFDVDNLVLSLDSIADLPQEMEEYLYEAQHIKQNYEDYINGYLSKFSSILAYALNSPHTYGIRKAITNILQNLREDNQIDFLRLNSSIKGSKDLNTLKDWYVHPDDKLDPEVAMRTLAISILYHRDPFVLKRMITGSTLLTHRNLRAIAANIGLGILIRELFMYSMEEMDEFKYDLVREISEFNWQLGRKASDVEKMSFEEKIDALVKKPNVDMLFLTSFDICSHPEREDEEYIEIVNSRAEELNEDIKSVIYFMIRSRNPNPNEGLYMDDIILETFKKIYSIR